MKYAVKTFDNQDAGNVTLNDAIFGVVEVRRDILARVVNWQLARRRAGTHKTKGISDISGTTKKPFKQKGGGRARHGSLRSPQFRGGATIFGPVVRDHGYKLNKKVRQMGLKMALSAKAQNGELLVLDSVPDSVTKTKDVVASLKALGVKSALFVLPVAARDALRKPAANVPLVDVLPTAGANVYDILRRRTLVLTKESVKELEGRLS